MKLVKEKQFLSFYLEEDKKVQYNLATGEYIGLSGNIVKDLNSQLKGYSIQEVIDSCDQEGYRNYLNKVYEVTSNNRYGYSNKRKYSNIGTFLKHVSENRCLEQYYIIGLEPDYSFAMRKKLSELPKGFIAKVREGTLKLDIYNLDTYNNYKDFIECYSKNKDDFNSITSNDLFGNRYRMSIIRNLIERYNYKIKSLLKYLDNIITYEGVDIYDAITELSDYLNMNTQMGAKYEKYPRYLLTTHQITVKNFRRFKTIINEEKFLKNKKDFLAWDYDKYKFIVPQKSNEIKEEGCQMSNCVASYIDRVCENQTNIVFMRLKEKKDKSLVTVEVALRDGVYKPVQYFQSNNRQCTREQLEVINKYREHLARINKKVLTQE